MVPPTVIPKNTTKSKLYAPLTVIQNQRGKKKKSWISTVARSPNSREHICEYYTDPLVYTSTRNVHEHHNYQTPCMQQV